MIAVITGDLVKSAEVSTGIWMPVLKNFLNRQGKSPKDWEIFRGDSFQFSCKPQEAFQKYLLLKSKIKQQPQLDVRISIGIGKIDFLGEKISESNGTAFVRSGRTFDQMKEKEYLAITTGTNEKDITLNLLARFASTIMDNWSPTGAEIVEAFLENPQWSQQQIADKLNINQSAVSQSRKRAQFDLIMDLNDYFRNTVSSVTT